jgi:hypothetical protein
MNNIKFRRKPNGRSWRKGEDNIELNICELLLEAVVWITSA